MNGTMKQDVTKWL